MSGDDIALDGVGEALWVDVIKRMDEVYSELLRNEADLESKNAELEDAQAFISSVFASVSDVLIVCDEKLAVRQVNQAFARLVGVAESACPGARLESFVVEEDRARAGRAACVEPARRAQEERRSRSPRAEVETLALGVGAVHRRPAPRWLRVHAAGRSANSSAPIRRCTRRMWSCSRRRTASSNRRRWRASAGWSPASRMS